MELFKNKLQTSSLEKGVFLSLVYGGIAYSWTTLKFSCFFSKKKKKKGAGTHREHGK